jgi:hypothetical protein
MGRPSDDMAAPRVDDLGQQQTQSTGYERGSRIAIRSAQSLTLEDLRL